MHKKILGRALKVDMPQIGKEKNDRLEPCATVQDVGETFDNLVVDHSRPIRVCFWRRSEETAIRHRNPLLLSSSSLQCPHHGRRLFALLVFGHLSAKPRARVAANRGPQTCSESTRPIGRVWSPTVCKG